jgi:hypothetical protein
VVELHVVSTQVASVLVGVRGFPLFTHDEVQLVKHAYEIASDGALLLAPNPQLPWEFTRLGAVRPRTLDGMFKDQPCRPPDLARAIAQLAGDTPTYLLLGGCLWSAHRAGRRERERASC